MIRENKKKNKEEIKEEEVIDVAELKKQIADLQIKNKEVFAGWQRAEADFLNYKKREAERLNEINIRVKENILEGFLPIIDNFNLAEKSISEEEKDNTNIKGLLLIKKQLDYFLKAIGIEEIISIGLPFNPLTCEAIEEISVEGMKGLVVEEVQKGYQLNGKVIRPAKVKVGK